MGIMLNKSYEVISNKHGIHGVINDYGMVIRLIFDYQDKRVEVALKRPFPFDDSTMCSLGEATIDFYIENLQVENPRERKQMLHYWFVDEGTYGGRKKLVAHGVISGHRKLDDTTFIHTSEVDSIFIDKEHAEAVIKTRNSIYHCPLEYCSWKKQDNAPELLPDYEWIRDNYRLREKLG